MGDPRGVKCPRCGTWVRRAATEAEALADCPWRDYAAEEAEERLAATSGQPAPPSDGGIGPVSDADPTTPQAT